MNILDQIMVDKRAEIDRRSVDEPVESFKGTSLFEGERPGFVESLRSVPMGLIAEVKRRSPSAGAIREPLDPALLAQQYESAGANAVSVLLDEKYFGGGEGDFSAVRSATSLPMLYKEFVVDPWQIWRARYLGASVVLLIAAALPDEELRRFMDVANEAEVETLVEVHSAEEMERAISLGAPCIGINNRNLKTFEVNIDTSIRLKEMAPSNCTLISESGIRSADDVMRLQRGGVHGILVGEHLLRQSDIEAAVSDLMGDAWGSL